MKENNNEDLEFTRQYQEYDTVSYRQKQTLLIIPESILMNGDSAQYASLNEPKMKEVQNSLSSFKMENDITHTQFSLAIHHAETILNHLNSEGEIITERLLIYDDYAQCTSLDEPETKDHINSFKSSEIPSDIYDYVRSLPVREMISSKFNYKPNSYTISNHHHQETARQIDYIFKLIDNIQYRALGYNLFVKDFVNKVPYDIEASSILPLLLYKIKTEDNLETIRIASEFTCKLSGFATNDWLIESAIHITEREIPSRVIMKHLGNAITCLCEHSNNSNEIIAVYFNKIQNYKTTVGKTATIQTTEVLVSNFDMHPLLHFKAVDIMKSYIDDEGGNFQSVKVILDIFQIKESLHKGNKKWAVRLANAVKIANSKYSFIDTHPFLEKRRDGEINFHNKEQEKILDTNQLEHCPEGYHNCNNEIDIYIVNNFDE